MAWDDASDLANRVAARARTYDREGTSAVCSELTERLHCAEATFPEREAKKILGTLRRKRFFDLLERMADAFIRNGQDGFQIRRQYAQALLDRGSVSAAIPFLESLAEDTRDGDASEHLEARGLLGRAYKQLYVDAAGAAPRTRKHLAEAIRWYHDVFDADAGQLWHGINVVALLCRAESDGIDLADFPEPGDEARRLAAAILETIEDRWDAGAASMWDCGTAAEACVALPGRDGDALEWTQRYVAGPQADAFELASTLRQLREVWRLAADDDLVRLLSAELLRHEGGRLEIGPEDLGKPLDKARLDHFEKVLGPTRYVSLKDLSRAFERARAVARIEDQPDHGVGTGFLVRGGDLHDSLGAELLLLTNSHVVSDDPTVVSPPPLMPDEATVTFQILREEGAPQERYEYEIAELVWTSPPGQLDATLLRLARAVEGIEPYPIAPRLPLADQEQRVYIAGHPKGGTLSFSLQDNILIAHEGPPQGKPAIPGVVRLHYRAPTDVGSSGSPVFNRQWKLIGLHHAGDTEMPKLNGEPGIHPANEGIWIQSIIAKLKQSLPAA